ncbi:FecR domain-containing protein [Agrobacterium rosae]|uniref:FecR family protein n=1 Tax=Agrobacterium rosae TaxID=1972867 RepID=UPI0019D36265|nr:FecR domain-containing protein [Agrobacterium rosae]MBN7808379.1 FecR domain-containing protein [Agrobacterium rosae]
MTSSSKRIHKEAIDWAIRLSETPSNSEIEQFDRWIDADPGHRHAYDRFSIVLEQTHIALVCSPEFTKKAFRRGGSPAKIIMTLVLVLLSGGTVALSDLSITMKADRVTAKGETTSQQLPDGSTVHLNSDTAVAFHFSDGIRQIEVLKGEAFFEVARSDSLGAFEVLTSQGTVTAVGTAFDVNLLERAIEVTVTESKVVVQSNASGKTRVVETGNRVLIDDAGIGSSELVPEEMRTPWRDGRLVFDDRPLMEVIDQIVRYIPGRIITLNLDTKVRRVTGSFNLSKGPRALDQFAETFGLKIKRAGKFLTIIY